MVLVRRKYGPKRPASRRFRGYVVVHCANTDGLITEAQFNAILDHAGFTGDRMSAAADEACAYACEQYRANRLVDPPSTLQDALQRARDLLLALAGRTEAQARQGIRALESGKAAKRWRRLAYVSFVPAEATLPADPPQAATPLVAEDDPPVATLPPTRACGLSRGQLVVLWGVVAALLVMVMVPPWRVKIVEMERESRRERWAGFYRTVYTSWQTVYNVTRPGGYRPLWSPPEVSWDATRKDSRGFELGFQYCSPAGIDAYRLSFQIVGLVAVAAAAMWTLRRRRENTARRPAHGRGSPQEAAKQGDGSPEGFRWLRDLYITGLLGAREGGPDTRAARARQQANQAKIDELQGKVENPEEIEELVKGLGPRLAKPAETRGAESVPPNVPNEQEALRRDGIELVRSLQKEMQVPGVVQPNSKEFPRLVKRKPELGTEEDLQALYEETNIRPESILGKELRERYFQKFPPRQNKPEE